MLEINLEVRVSMYVKFETYTLKTFLTHDNVLIFQLNGYYEVNLRINSRTINFPYVQHFCYKFDIL